MKTNIHEYYLEQLRKGNDVHIEIKRVIRNHKGYDVEEFDWIIDNRFVLHDMPSEVFEEEYVNDLHNVEETKK